MDGTTVGPLSTPQPTAPAGDLFVDHSSYIDSNPVTSPVTQPQFSQLTPIYAPGPTNTVDDIPQPLVKGIEFVQAPTPMPMPPAPVMPPVPQPVVVTPDPLPASAALPLPPAQLIQPVLPPMPVAPIAATPPVQSFEEPTTTVDDQFATTLAETQQSESDHKLQEIENTNIDQAVGAIPVSTLGSTVIDSVAQAPVIDTGIANYFSNPAPAPRTSDIIINNTPVGKPSIWSVINTSLNRKIAIIVLAVALLGGGGFLVYSNFIAPNLNKKAATTATSAPAASQPVFTQPTSTDTTTTATDTTSTSTDTTTTAATTTTPDTTTQSSAASTTTTPAVTTPASTATTTTTPVSNTGLQY
jgi:hypothetical protein